MITLLALLLRRDQRSELKRREWQLLFFVECEMSRRTVGLEREDLRSLANIELFGSHAVRRLYLNAHRKNKRFGYSGFEFLRLINCYLKCPAARTIALL